MAQQGRDVQQGPASVLGGNGRAGRALKLAGGGVEASQRHLEHGGVVVEDRRECVRAVGEEDEEHGLSAPQHTHHKADLLWLDAPPKAGRCGH